MDTLFYVFAGSTGVAAALASVAIWAPRPTRVRVLAVIIAALFLPVVYVQLIEMLSKPKPMSFEWYERNEDRATVLGISFSEGQSIYLWLRLAGSVEPRYYRVPWNLRLAERLEDAVDDAVTNNGSVVITKPFLRRSFEEWGDLSVEIVPPPLPPLKTPTPAPRIYNPRKEKI